MTQDLGVPFRMLWIHSFGFSIGGGIAVVVLEWGAETCGVIP